MSAFTPIAQSSLASGAVVVFDPDNNNSVKTTTTSGATNVAGVCISAATVGNPVNVRSDGDLVIVNVAAGTARGEWLISHTVAGQAIGVATWQKGVFGYARSNIGTPAAGQCYAVISVGASWIDTGAIEADIATNTTHSNGDGSDHADVATNTTHSAGDGSDHADVATNTTHSAGDGSDHANVALNDTHRASDGTDHANVALNDTHRASDGTDHSNVKKSKFDATTAPTANEDSGDGYAVGSFWHDITNDKSYVCLDASVGAAVWIETTQSGGGAGDFTIDSSFPGAPGAGELFYHTTHDTLFQYEGGWIPLFNYSSTLNLYVDSGSGSDAAGKGYGSGADATASIQYCWDHCVPKFFNGTITITISAATYTETVVLAGRTPGSSTAEIILQGTLSNQDTGTATSGTTTTLTDSGASWGVNAYQDMMLRITSGTNSDEIYRIKSNTATTITIYGQANPAFDNTSVYSIDNWGTLVNGGAGNKSFELYGQKRLTLKYFKGNNCSMFLSASRGCELTLIGMLADSANVTSWGFQLENTCLTKGECLIADTVGSLGLGVGNQSYAALYRCVFKDNGGRGMQIADDAYAFIMQSETDNNTGQGIQVRMGSTGQFYTGANVNHINNETVGIDTATGSIGAGATAQTYSGCTTDQQADATSHNT